MIPNLVILAFVTLERLFELLLSRRNTRGLLKSGAREHGSGHYGFIVAVHALWLASLWSFARYRPIDLFWLAFFVFLEICRVWVLATLGSRWTTRIIVLPGAPLIESGPYRLINHPNYWVVIGEIAVLPLVFGLWRIALLFSLLNGAALAIRVREENRALGR